MFWILKQKLKKWGRQLKTFWKEKIVSDPLWKLDDLLRETKDYNMLKLEIEYHDLTAKYLDLLMKKELDDMLDMVLENTGKTLSTLSKKEIFEFKKEIAKNIVPIYNRISIHRFNNSSMDEVEVMGKITDYVISDNYYTKRFYKLDKSCTRFLLAKIIYKSIALIRTRCKVRTMHDKVLENAYIKLERKPLKKPVETETFSEVEKASISFAINSDSYKLALYLYQFSEIDLESILNISNRKKSFRGYFSEPDNHEEFLRQVDYYLRTTAKKNKKYFFEGRKKGFPIEPDNLRHAVKLACKSVGLTFTESKFLNFHP